MSSFYGVNRKSNRRKEVVRSFLKSDFFASTFWMRNRGVVSKSFAISKLDKLRERAYLRVRKIQLWDDTKVNFLVTLTSANRIA